MTWAPDYATTTELAAFARIEDSADAAQQGKAIAAASRAIDEHTHRQFGQVPAAEPRLYTARWSTSRGAWVVPIDDLMTMTGFALAADRDGDGVFETVLTAAAVLRPHNAAQEGRPWTEVLIRPTSSAQPTGDNGAVQGIGRWGWSAIPLAVNEACLMQANRLMFRRDAPHGIAGSPQNGAELRMLARLDPDVVTHLKNYNRKVFVR